MGRRMRVIGLCAILLATPVAAEIGNPDWTVSLGGGTSRLGSDLDQTYGSGSLTRRFGETYVRGSATFFSGDDNGGQLRTSAETQQFGLALGHSFGALTIEANGTIGSRSFDDVRLAGPNGQTVTVGGDGDLWSVGGSLAYLAPLSENWTLIPFATLDYSKLDVARSVAGPRGRATANPFVQVEDGVTGSAGVSLDLEVSTASIIGAQIAVVATSNAASATRAGRGAATQRLIEGQSASETWAEAGASAAIGLTGMLILDLSVVQTIGLSPSNATTGAVAIRFSF